MYLAGWPSCYLAGYLLSVYLSVYKYMYYITACTCIGRHLQVDYVDLCPAAQSVVEVVLVCHLG